MKANRPFDGPRHMREQAQLKALVDAAGDPGKFNAIAEEYLQSTEAEQGSRVDLIESLGRNYVVIIEPSEIGFAAHFPWVAGCTSEVGSVTETLANAAKALRSTKARSAFHTAIGFHEGALRCTTEDPLPGGGCCSPSAPTVANAAFAIELYFKALSLERGKSARGHDLADLFRNALEEGERQAIGARWEEGHFPSTYESMIEALDHLADAFRTHRYQYEQDRLSVSLGSLCRLVRACYLGARDIVPQWPVHPQMHQRLKLFGLNGVDVPRGPLPRPQPNPNANLPPELL